MTFLSSTAVPNVNPLSLPAAKKNTWLPLLTVLFILSYGLMTMLIVEQGSTIEQQRALIQELFRDSRELSAVKGKTVHDKNVANTQRHGQAHAPSTQVHDPAVQSPSTQLPATQIPATNAPSTQVPSSQVTPQARARTRVGKNSKPRVQIPARPPADLADERRASMSI